MKRYILNFFFFYTSLYSVTFQECQHFLLRTSFSIQKQELQNCLSSTEYNSYIYTYLLNNQQQTKNSLELQIIQKDKTAQNNIEFRKQLNNEQEKLKLWYINTLLSTKQPLKEKMVLFWHNHFTSSLQKVRQAKYMYMQNELFRKYALGNFKELVHAIIKDPAMLIYLDNRVNKKSHPNENLARELLELFTLGEGHYSESDIKALARGLTGYSISKNSQFQFKKAIHDKSKKTFMSKTGNFSADDMLDILFENEQVSLYITTKLYKEFVSYDLDQQAIKKFAKIFRESNYELSSLMFAILTSKQFRDQKNYNTMIKSPLELTIGTLRSFHYQNFDPKIVLRFLQLLQQDLLNPPNVKGDKGELSWINANTLIDRQTFLSRLINDEAVYNTSLQPQEISQIFKSNNAAPKSKNKRQYIRKILLDPTYQLK